MKIGEDKYLERKDVVDNATGVYFIYQREVTISHYAEVSLPQQPSSFDPHEVSWMSDPEGNTATTGSATRLNTVTGRGDSTYRTVTYGRWYRYGPYEMT